MKYLYWEMLSQRAGVRGEVGQNKKGGRTKARLQYLIMHLNVRLVLETFEKPKEICIITRRGRVVIPSPFPIGQCFPAWKLRQPYMCAHQKCSPGIPCHSVKREDPLGIEARDGSLR